MLNLAAPTRRGRSFEEKVGFLYKLDDNVRVSILYMFIALKKFLITFRNNFSKLLQFIGKRSFEANSNFG